MIDIFNDEKSYLTPLEDSNGRIVTGFNGFIIGLEMKPGELENNMVYAIESVNGILTLKKIGESHIDFNSTSKNLDSLLLMERTELILTEAEKYNLELKEEIEDYGFTKIKDKYLSLSNNPKFTTRQKIAQMKLKLLTVMFPPSKYPEKWI